MHFRFALLCFVPKLKSFSPVSGTRFLTLRGGAQSSATSGCSLARGNLPSSGKMQKTLVQAEELLNTASSIKFVDGSWYMDKARKPMEEFSDAHIEGARFFDIDDVSDKSSSLPHMMPSQERFAEEMNKMCISNSDHVVIYSGPQCFSAARVWWTFRAFGHDNVSLLDGGINAWKQAGGSVTNVPTSINNDANKQPYIAKLNKKLVVSLAEVAEIRDTGIAQLCDARSTGRFFGTAPEPRAGLIGGHIPGSLNVPFAQLLSTDDMSKFKTPEEIRDIFLAAGVVFGSRVVTTCGSGVTAAVLTLGLDLMGKPLEDAPIYDGSWTEYGDPNLDVPRMTE